MIPEHFIQWILLETSEGIQQKPLAPGQEPRAVFQLSEHDKVVSAYEYCNLHGLWKETFSVKEAPALDSAMCSPEFGGCVIHDV